MATLFEQSINYNTRCFACGSLVYAVEKKMTTHHIYHNRCFRCRICKRNLTGYSLNEEGDDIYCENCYRKKQRGDCNSLEFTRAAAERAHYVHSLHHPDQQNSLTNSRPTSLRDVTRHPSLTLRHLERQFFSYQQPNSTNHQETTNETNRKSLSTTHPFTLNTSFSAPFNLTKLRNNSSSSTKDEPSPHFSPIFSPVPTVRTETTITPRVRQRSNETTDTNDDQTKSVPLPTGSATGGIEFRLNKSSIDLTNVTSSSSSLRTNRRSVIIPDLNPNNEQKESKFRFPDFNMISVRRRSSSANHRKNPLRID